MTVLDSKHRLRYSREHIVLTPCCRAGLLYEPNDYDTAVKQIKQLLEDKEFGLRVGLGGREEVERWGWSAATKNLRTKQYSRAINNKRAHKRFGFLALRMGIAQLLRPMFRFFAALLAAIADFLRYDAAPTPSAL